jgi:isopropylmalate/homocitrate/citramalate synthase
MVMQLGGVSQPSNRPVTGTRLFNVESGIISTWVRNVREKDLTEAFPYLPELVGQEPVELVLGKGSGLDSVLEAVERLGLSASMEEAQALLHEVKVRSTQTKGLVSLEEFSLMAERTLSTSSPRKEEGGSGQRPADTSGI